MSRHEEVHEAGTVALLTQLARHEEAFAEPWQATAFALAVRLSAQGHFTWKEWAAVLAEELKAEEELGEPDQWLALLHCWVAAPERLVMAKRLSDLAALLERKKAWAKACRRTPHGKPARPETESSP